MKLATTPGETYAVTAAVPCTVHAVLPDAPPLLLLTIELPGQYLVTAPSSALDIDQDTVLVTRSFNPAPAARPFARAACGGINQRLPFL